MSGLWFHGTDRTSFENILAAGFNRQHNWFARDLTVARRLGGPYILGVVLHDIPEHNDDGEPIWQVCLHKPITTEHIVVAEKERTNDNEA